MGGKAVPNSLPTEQQKHKWLHNLQLCHCLFQVKRSHCHSRDCPRNTSATSVGAWLLAAPCPMAGSVAISQTRSIPSRHSSMQPRPRVVLHSLLSWLRGHRHRRRKHIIHKHRISHEVAARSICQRCRDQVPAPVAGSGKRCTRRAHGRQGEGAVRLLL